MLPVCPSPLDGAADCDPDCLVGTHLQIFLIILDWLLRNKIMPVFCVNQIDRR